MMSKTTNFHFINKMYHKSHTHFIGVLAQYLKKLFGNIRTRLTTGLIYKLLLRI